MADLEGAAFDPQTIKLLQSVLDEVWASLLPEQQAQVSRVTLARRILKAAANGERDPVRLRAHALIAMAPSGP